MDDARAGLPGWTDEQRRAYQGFVKVIEAPADDPFMAIPHLQQYVDSLPLDEFEQSDWVTLHADLVCFLAESMIVRFGASWQVREAAETPRGYRYVLRLGTHDVDPFEVVAQEFRNQPIDVVRMLATTELNLGRGPEPDPRP